MQPVQHVHLFQGWGIGHFLLALLVGVALIRYRSMVALATLFMLGEQVIRMILRLNTELPGIHRDWTALGTLVSYSLLAAMVLGLALSLWQRRSVSEA